MSTILLFRHGETHWNREKRVQGRGDSPLTLKGIEQAKAYGRTLKAVLGDDLASWRLVSSPLPRCLQTAGILCEVSGLSFAGLTRDDRLAEVSTGRWSGKLKSEMTPDDLDGTGVNAWFFRAPGGESYAQVAARLEQWLADRKHGDKLVAISHSVSGRVLRGIYAGLDPDAALAADGPQDAFFKLHDGKVERIQCV